MPAAAATQSNTSERPPAVDGAEQLVKDHLGLVYHVARQLARAKAIELELEELVSAGTLGLIQALQHFDPTRGLAFSTFAAPRIRGAMLDELRRQDHVPRSVRRHARAISRATDELTGELGRAPEPTRVAQRMGVDLDTFFAWRSDSNRTRMVPIESASAPPRGPKGSGEERLAVTGVDVDDLLTHAQEVEHLRVAIGDLPGTERQVLVLYYFEELRLHEIAQILDVSESRVSQIRSRAVSRLRRQLARLRAGL